MAELTQREFRALMATAGGATPDQIARLTRDQIARLTPAQIAWLTPDQIARLTPDQIARLTPAQIAWLTPAQIAKREDLWARVPAVDRLYTQILKGISEERRVLDQSTFGPDSESEASVCNTPMCIAGHTVNVAGSAGYELLESMRGDFGATAALIHAKSRPEAPRPRYDSYPNDWALAFIEERAAEEAEGNGIQ
jgi:hypothetical protein